MRGFNSIILIFSFMSVLSCSDVNEPETDKTIPQILRIKSDFDGMAVYGYPVTIVGEKFSAAPSGNKVRFGDVEVSDLIESSETSITVNVPVTDGYVLPVIVESDGVESPPFILRYDEFRCDSVLIFANAHVEELCKGVVWKKVMTVWEGEPRSLNVVSVDPSQTDRIGIAYPALYSTTSSQAETASAILAVNGAYFGGSKHDGFVRIGGTVYNNGGRDCSAFFADGALTLTDDGPIIQSVNGNAGAAALSASDVLCSGPLLISSGMRRKMVMEDGHNHLTHPRTAIGMTKDGHFIFVTVDGRFPSEAVGMSTDMLARFMKILGAHYAMNLDGGGSTTMWIKGKGVVNHPSDGAWDAAKERKVGSIIYLK